MNDCNNDIPHPGVIEIYENGILRERVAFSDYPIRFIEIKATIDGKECMQKIPVETVYETYLDSNGQPVKKDLGFIIKIEGVDKNGRTIFHADGRNDRNR